jgi:protease IV
VARSLMGLLGFSGRFRAGRVAIIRLYGPITGGARNAEWLELVRRLRENNRVPAVVVDIDSPGGSAAASDNTFMALERLAAAKPVVAAITGTGASGAYLAAIAARRIVAAPTSVVGSIGVINVAPRVPALLERLGIAVSEHTAGRLKGMGAPWRTESEPEAAKEQQLVDQVYDAFVERVAGARKLTPRKARSLATGEVWLGRQAVALASSTRSVTCSMRSKWRPGWPAWLRRPESHACRARSLHAWRTASPPRSRGRSPMNWSSG